MEHSRDHSKPTNVVDKPSAMAARAFPPGPKLSSYFATESARRVTTALVRCVERLEGPALLIGASGVGKSLLLAVIGDHFRFRLSVATLTGGLLRTPRELHQAVLYALGMPFRDMDEGELRLSLVNRLEEEDNDQEGVLLLVDEAQSLAIELLEELRMLTNVTQDGESRVRLVMAGTSALEEQLADPRLEALHQRIAVRCYLTEMSRSETKAYIAAHLEAHADGLPTFEPEALDKVYELTEGLPRLVNQVCDHALLLAHAQDRHEIDEALVDEAWGDLQQFPVPPTSMAPDDTAPHGEIIEFGSLEEPSEFEVMASDSTCEQGDWTEGIVDASDEGEDPPQSYLLVDGDPDARIDDIERHLASIHHESDALHPFTSAQSPPRVLSPARPDAPENGLKADVSEIDFSLPTDEWPEVEVLLREPSTAQPGEFQEEEVVAEPFQSLPGVALRAWSCVEQSPPEPSLQTWQAPDAHMDATSEESDVLHSVPLMVQVQTRLFASDPVLPEEPAVAIAASTVRSDPGDRPHPADAAWRPSLVGTPGEEEPAHEIPTPPSTRPHASPAPPVKRRFATLFSSLKKTSDAAVPQS